MRIPLNNIYRAFSELDRFTDEECVRLMQRVRLDSGGKLASTASGFLTYFALLIVLVILAGVIELSMGRMKLNQYQLLIDLIGLVLIFGLPLLPTLLVRDTVLRRQLTTAIDRHIERVKCLGCSYLLIGQTPRDRTVRCPECGQVHTFEQLGITEQDLIPPVKGASLV